MPDELILETRDLTREFRGFIAVNKVNLQVRRGSIHALIGPNGAGKTTVFNLLTKFLQPTRGRILFAGKDITRTSPARIARMGMVRSFQISATFADYTALDNVLVALQRPLGLSMHFWRSRRVLDRLNDRAVELLTHVGLHDALDTPAGELPYGRKRALELATTLALEPELLLLDEPTAGMAAEDVDRVAELIKRVTTNRTVLMVEHNLNVVAKLADTITVLQRGEVLTEGDYQSVSADPQVREAYLGRRREAAA